MTGEPRIFVRVERVVDDARVAVNKEVPLAAYLQAKHPGAFVRAVIDEALAEVGWGPKG